MALFQGSVRSLSMQMDTNVNVIAPVEEYIERLAPLNKTVILLHGLKQNADAWVRMSRVETYAARAGFYVVMPEAQRSFYTDMAYGIPYYTWIQEELPELIGRMFHMPMDPEHLYIAGLSMGGYGAMRLAMSRPERYAGAMSYSGCCMILEEDITTNGRMASEEFRGIVGADLTVPPEMRLSTLVNNPGVERLKYYAACGTEDWLWSDNLKFKKLMLGHGLKLTFEQWPGVHNWDFWDEACRRSFALMAGIDPAILKAD